MLQDALKQLIAARGPMSVATYMRQCLTHPEFGYYMKRDPLGSKGDFITSPEISQMFGELVGINVLTQWMALGEPQAIRLVELGPGRGTLMADLLRASRSFPRFHKAISGVLLVEASPTLRQAQREKLEPFGRPLDWLDFVKEVPKDRLPTFFVAHEFFDALPVHQFEKTKAGWKERVIAHDKKSDKLFPYIGGSDPIMSAAVSAQPRYERLPELSQIEICPEAWEVAKEMRDTVVTNTGGALIMDYGPDETIPTNSFRGFRDHHQVDPFTTPGEADLTADVDFQALKDIFLQSSALKVYGPIKQADWLHNMGIGARATVLAQNQDADGQKRVADAYKRLTDPLHMGKTYKVMAVTSSDAPVAGFETQK